jgi:hypothetical protein
LNSPHTAVFNQFKRKAGIEDLPAVKWKLINIKRMDKKKHKKAPEKLSHYLEK